MKSAMKNIITLALITLVAGFCLGYVYEVTKEPIALMEEKTKQDAYKKVFEAASDFTAVECDEETCRKVVADAGISGVDITEVMMAEDSSANSIGYVITATSHEGYGGDIRISVGIANDGTVLGVEILEISETAGLGMKANTDQFKNQFKNKKVNQFVYTKTGASADYEIDAISGATITTKAFTNAVNASIAYFSYIGGAADA